MGFLYVSPLIIYIPAGIYLFCFFKRFLTLFPFGNKKIPSTALSALFAVFCAALGWRVYGLGAVIVLHFVLILVLCEGVNWILKRAAASERFKRIWEIVFKSGLVSIVATAVVFCYGYINIQDVRETVYSVRSQKNLVEPLRIVQISDLHMGTTMDVEALNEYCGRIGEREPDLVVLTGDIFDESTERSMMMRAVPALAGISARYGVYYVWGNHDPNRYRRDPNYSMDELRQTLLDNGIRVLEDEAVQVTPQLAVIGRYDVSNVSNRKGIDELLQGIDPASYIVLLDHRPIGLEENASAGVDLQLSGHTHAGQIWPTGQLSELLGINEKNYGMESFGNYHAIVSSGIAGWGYAIRTGGHSEYVIVDVQGRTS